VLTVRVATRGSPLALRQAELVADALQAARRGVGAREIATELVVVDTAGDLRRDLPIGALGGQGMFAKEVELALLEGRADVAVHSTKDLPSSSSADELDIFAVPRRADPRDALVGLPIHELGPGAHVATGAARRRAQLAWLRPDLRFEELRGNIAARLDKLPPAGAVVVAFAALERLGLSMLAAEVLPTSKMLPQVGQGCLAVQCRKSDEAVAEAVRSIDDATSHRCLDAERAFLRELGGSCELPVGAYAVAGLEGGVKLEGLIASLDGLVLLRRRMSGPDPLEVGRELAREMRDRCGGAELLSAGAGVL